MRRVRCIGVGACLLFAVTRARADDTPPPPATLHYATPEGEDCPRLSTFENLVAARLGYAPFEPSAPRDVSVHIVRAEGVLIAKIQLTAGSALVGKRELRAGLGACESLATAVATAVSIALDPRSAAGPVPPPAAPEPEPEPAAVEPAPPPRSEPTPPPAASTATPLRFEAQLSGIGALGVTPGPSLGGLAALGVRTDIWSVSAEGRLETTVGSVVLDSGDRVSAVAMNAGLVPCVHLDPAFGCLVVYAGAFQGESDSVEKPTLKSTITSAFAARAGVVWPVLDALRLRAHLELGVPLVRTELRIEDAAVWRASPLYASAGVGVATLLP